MKVVRVQATCELMGHEVAGRVVVRHGKDYFTVPTSVITDTWEVDVAPLSDPEEDHDAT